MRLATLNSGDGLSLVFESYDEMFQGSYPNLKYCFKVKAKFIGNLSFSATNTIRFADLSITKYMSFYGSNDSGWFYLGEIIENAGCSRTFKRQYSCSCYGYPNLSGQGNITSSEIPLPTFQYTFKTISENEIDIIYSFTSNPHNIYALWVKNTDTSAWVGNCRTGNGVIKDGILSKETLYHYLFEVRLADNSSNALITKTGNQSTLANYPELVVTGCSIKTSSVGGLTKAEFTMEVSDPTKVQNYHFQLSGKNEYSSSSNYYSVSDLPNNTEITVTCWTTDSVGRTSNKYIGKSSTQYTSMEVYVFDKGMWRRGYPMVLNNNVWEMAMIHPYDGVSWRSPRPLQV